MKGMFSDPAWTYPLYIRQMMADQNSAPHANGEYDIREEKADFAVSMTPVEYTEYLRGD